MNINQSAILWRHRSFWGAVALLLLAPAVADAQLVSVASVTEHQQPRAEFAPGSGIVFHGNRLYVREMHLEDLVAYAFDVRLTSHRNKLIVGWPDGLNAKLFTITANLSRENLSRADERRAVLELLTSRFGFKAHIEQREMAVSRLRLVKPGVLGSGLRRVDFNCAELAAADAPKDRSGRSLCRQGVEFGARSMRTHGSGSIDRLVMSLSVERQGVVVDDTGLAGFYVWDYEYPPGRGAALAAVRDALGLQLVPGKASVPVVVIDAMQMPAPN